MGIETGERLTFTKAQLERLAPADAGKRRLVYDTKVAALCIRINDKGEKVFYFAKRGFIKKLGQSIWKKAKIGQFPTLTIDQARHQAQEWSVTLEKGIDPLEEKAGLREEITLGHLFEEYVSRHMEKKRKTVSATRQEFERDFAQWSGRKLSSITHLDCEQLHGRLGKTKGIYTANRRIQLLRALFNKAKQWKLFFDENPCTGITLFDETPRERFLTDEEAGRLLTVLEEEPHRDICDFVRLSLFTGLRKRNVLSIKWAHVDLVAGTLFVPDTKNGTSQKIRLSNDEIALFKARIEFLKFKQYSCAAWPDSNYRAGVATKPTEFVFPGSGESGHLEDPKRQWTRVRDLARIPDVHIHDLRRSLASAMASNNVELPLIQKAMNHSDSKTTLAVYAKIAKESERDAREVAHNVWKRAAKKEEEARSKLAELKDSGIRELKN